MVGEKEGDVGEAETVAVVEEGDVSVLARSGPVGFGDDAGGIERAAVIEYVDGCGAGRQIHGSPGGVELAGADKMVD